MNRREFVKGAATLAVGPLYLPLILKPPKRLDVFCEQVLDGQYIMCRTGAHLLKFTLIGVDAPVGSECYAGAAAIWMRAAAWRRWLVAEFGPVEWTPDAPQGGAWLAYLYNDAGQHLNADMLRSGHARYVDPGANRAHAWALQQAEAEARREERGLWGACGAYPGPYPYPAP